MITIRFALLMVISINLIMGCNSSSTKSSKDEIKLKTSLAQWSLNKQFSSGELKTMGFARTAAQMGFEGIEYVNSFFKDKADDFIYLDSLSNEAEAAGITQLLIMVDGEGSLADPDELIRTQAIENHKRWVRTASYLGCHSIRVNLFGNGSPDELTDASVLGLTELSDFAAEQGINIIVENHGGLSSDASWLADVMLRVKRNNCGTLPDFGNFCIKRESGSMWEGKCIEEYDKYQGVKEMLPFAKAVSAKSYDFDNEGEETTIEYKRMIKLVKDSGYTGFIGVEYEGDKMSAYEGIKKTKALIEKYL